MSIMDISVVIPNFNGENLLKKNIPKLIEVLEDFIQTSGKRIEVIIADDNSQDESIGVIKDLILKYQGSNGLLIKLVEGKSNIGFSGNVNRGVREATGDFLLLLNTDVIPRKGFLQPLLVHFKDPEMFAVACMDESVEGGKVILRGRGIGSWKRGFLIHSKGSIEKTNTLWISGGSGLFRKSIWDKLGGLNEIYNPFYWEDIDLSYRALKSGFKIAFEKESKVIHEHETGAIKSRFSSFDVKTMAYRNQYIFVWQNLTDLNLKLIHVMWLPYYFAKAVLNKDASFFLGFFKALNLIPKIIESNSKRKKLFIKSDKEVTAPFNE